MIHYGFIEKEVDGVKAVSQSSSVYLDHDNIFSLRPDLILQATEKKIIVDTKYKIIYKNPKDPKKGNLQSDLYQVLAYAVRYKIDEVLLLYPETLTSTQDTTSGFTIRDEFAEQVDVRVTAYQLPVINREMFEEGLLKGKPLGELFEGTREKLIGKMKDVLLPHIVE